MNYKQKRINHLLWMQMDHYIHRYLMANTEGRQDGFEKAHHHMELTKIYLASILFCDKDRTHYVNEPNGMEMFEDIHDHTQELTSYLDTEIGFPLDDTRPDYDTLAPLFFNRFIELADEAAQIFCDRYNIELTDFMD